MRLNLTDGASVGASFTFLQTQADIFTGPEFQGQLITVGLSLVIGIVAKLVTKVFAALFTKKRVTESEVMRVVQESINQEMAKKGVVLNDEELALLANKAAQTISQKIRKNAK